MDGEDDNLIQGGTHEEDFGDMDMEPMNEVVEPADDLPPADGETEDGMLEPPQEIDVPNNDVAADGEPNVEPMEVQPDEAPYDEQPDMPMDEQPAEYEAQAHEQPAYIFHEEPAGDAVEQPEEVMEEPPADQDYYQPEEDRMDDGQPIDADAYYSADVHVDAMHEEAQPEDEYAHHEPSDELMEMPVGEPLEEPVDEVDVEQPQPQEVYDEPRQLDDDEAQQPEEADDQLPVEQHEQPQEIYEEQPAEMEYEQPNTAHPADETDEQSNEIYDEQPAAVEIVDEQPAEAVVAPAVDEEPTADPEEEAAPSDPVDASADVAAGSAGEDEHPEQVQLENPQEEDEAVQEPAPEEQEAEGAAVVEEGEEQPTTTEDAQDAAGSMEMVDESDRGPVSEQPESVGDQLTISEGAPYEEAGALAATIQGPSDEQVVAPTEVPPQSERATVPLETETVAEDAAEEQPATADAEEAPAADDAPATTAEDPASVAPHTEAEGATEKVPSPPRSARPRSRSPKGTRRTASPDRIAVSSEVPTYQRSPPRTVAMAGGSMVRVQQPQDAAAEEAEQRMVMGGDDSPDWYVQFRRGYDNSHVNRMMEGSYSRFLLSTDNVPDTNLMGSFYGSVAMTGTMPIHAALARAPQRPMNEIQYSPRRVASRGGVRSSSEAGRPYRTAHNMGGTMSSTLRREQELMDGPEYTELCGQRERRRRDPRHCREVPGPGDYVYYNHKSKGFYIPQDAPPDTLMLNYNHLYDFGDGSRFLTPGEPARRNPGAAPPKSYAETRGAARWRATSGRRAGSANQGGVQFREDPAVQRREEIRKGASSLRVAKAVDVQKLHCSQFRKTRTIEEVIAEDNHYVDESAVGIEHVVHTGKLNWSDMPANLRTVVTNNTAASDRQYSPNRGGMPAVSGAGTAQQRQGGARLAGIQRPNSQSGSAMTFTDRPGPGVLDVVGNTRDGSFQQARMNTTASSNGGQSFDRCPPLVHPTKPAEPQHAQPEPPVSLPSAGKPYEMSRLHFIKRHHPQTTPSAYV